MHARPTLAPPSRLRLKYAIDRVVAVLSLVVVGPVMAAVAIAIKLDDRGPVFFRQERVGLRGRRFRIWKFRTMIVNAEDIGKGYIPEGSDLVTKIGAFLRRSSLDEVPQVLNIVTGEMSFVGPRPTIPSQVERYTAEQRGRLLVKPGVLGWAQLHGRDSLPWSKRIQYDLEYVERASLPFDAEIIWRTVPMVLRGGGVSDDVQPWQVDDLGEAS